jgi:flavodoxin I
MYYTMPKINIIYSTIGGNTELVVQKVIELLPEGIEHRIIRVDTAKLEDIDNCDLVILASPTYGQGTIEAQFPRFLKLILDKVESKKFAVIGLGDTKYYPEYLTESGAILESWITENKGILAIPGLRIGMPPLKFIDKLVPRWVDKLVQSLNN